MSANVETRLVLESAKDANLKELVPGMEESGRTFKSYAGVVAGLSFVPLSATQSGSRHQAARGSPSPRLQPGVPWCGR